MGEHDFMQLVGQWANDILIWIGFGTLVGLLAKAVMPGRDPGGAVATLMMGIGGSIIGSGTLMWISGGTRVTPISPLGFLVATAGAFILLFFYRLLAGHFFTERGTHHHNVPAAHFTRARSRSRRRTTIDDAH